jgi:hypothetical protein
MLEMNIRKKNNLHKFLELQNHRYDPGFYLGGNVNPIISARRPNKYGYVLIVLGVFFFLLVIKAWPRIEPKAAGFIPLAFAVLVISAGAKLIKRCRGYKKNSRNHR